jgi:hypothetical protein
LQLLPTAVPGSFQHDQGRAAFPVRCGRYYKTVQHHTSAADEGHARGRDGLRLGGRGFKRDGDGSKDDHQEPTGPRPQTLRRSPDASDAITLGLAAFHP